MKTLLLALTATLGIAQAHAEPPPVSVTDAWSRATPPGAQAAAVYMTLTSPAADKLVAITTPAAKTAQVHEMTMNGNVMQMRELAAGLDLPAGKPVSLQPGGYHVMLMGLATPLKRGQTIHLHLTFQTAPPIDLDAPIAAIGASHRP